MALINCPECDKQVSDKVKVCPNCGYPFGGADEVAFTANNSDSAPQKVEVTGVSVSKKSRKLIIILIIVILAVAVSIFIYRYISEQNAKEEHRLAYNDYIDKLDSFRLLSLDGASDAEALCNLAGRVWRNTIYKDQDLETVSFVYPNGVWIEDFNEALALLYDDSLTKEKISNIEANQATVKDMWKTLQEPPLGMEKCYEFSDELFEAYNSLVGLSISPTGSLTSFSEKKQEYIDEYLKCFDRLENNIPKKLSESSSKK